MASTIEQQAKGNKQGEVRYLTPLDIDTKKAPLRVLLVSQSWKI